MDADLILYHGLVTTLDRSNPSATAIAIKDGKFLAVGSDAEIMKHAGPQTKTVDLRGKRVLPGLNDNHTHVVRGGLNFNMELRWDGIRSLADAMDMLRRQVAVTPAPQWVRVIGGFTEHQFVEKRLPTIDEINAIAPDTPVFLLHLYDRALLNAAAVRAVGFTKDTKDPPGGEITRDAAGNPTGLLLAKPNAGILYATLAKGPKLPFDYQVNSTRHFMRELNRLGVTAVIDAGGGFQNYPDDYAVIQKLADEDLLTVRLAYNLFTQKPKEEKEDFLRWTSSVTYKQGTDYFRHNVPAKCWSSPPPISRIFASHARTCRRRWKAISKRWSGSLPKTAGPGACTRPMTRPSRGPSTCSKRSTAIRRWMASTGSSTMRKQFPIVRSTAWRLSAAVSRLQHRMAYQGEYFVERYGHGAAEATPPIAKMLDRGVHVSAGTDATRVASYNPWVSLSWMITGKTVGGMNLYPRQNCLDRETALRMWTEKVQWFSNEEGRKGRIEAGQFADLIVPSKDYFSCPEDEISFLTSDLTIVGGKVVYGAGDFSGIDAPPLPPAMPDWSPVRTFGGYAGWGEPQGAGKNSLRRHAISSCGCANDCGVHGHDHAGAWTSSLPISDLKGFFGALGCSCWAV